MRTCEWNSAYGKRSGGFANVRRRPQRASFLDPVFAVYRQRTLLFAGVAVRVAVQASAVQQRLMLLGKEHSPFPTIPCLMRGSSCEKVPGARAICAIGFPFVSCVQHTLAFSILGRDHVDFCMIRVLCLQNVSSTFIPPQNWGNLRYCGIPLFWIGALYFSAHRGWTPRHRLSILSPYTADSPDGSPKTLVEQTYGIIEPTSRAVVPQRKADFL